MFQTNFINEKYTLIMGQLIYLFKVHKSSLMINVLILYCIQIIVHYIHTLLKGLECVLKCRFYPQ